MDVTFDDDDLANLEKNEGATSSHSKAILRSFRKVMRIIRDANDERDIRAMKSLRLEKLKGDRDGQYSMRLNDQWRLILHILETEPKHTIHVIEITDYH